MLRCKRGMSMQTQVACGCARSSVIRCTRQGAMCWQCLRLRCISLHVFMWPYHVLRVLRSAAEHVHGDGERFFFERPRTLVFRYTIGQSAVVSHVHLHPCCLYGPREAVPGSPRAGRSRHAQGVRVSPRRSPVGLRASPLGGKDRV